MEIDLSGLAGGEYTIIFKNTASGILYRSRIVVIGRSF
jgi:hypothetical protein